MNQIVVFGGSGFLGSHVVDELIHRGHDVTSFDLRENRYNFKVKNTVGNILNREEVHDAIEGADYVYNFAGIADMDSISTKAIPSAESNIIGNINILEGCRRHNVKKFLYASTIYVYSEKGGFYRCSKQASESYVEEYKRKYGVDYTILRYGTLYGPRSTEANSIHSYIKQALKSKKIKYGGTGDEVREYIYVHDAAKLSVNMLEQRYDNFYGIITGHNTMKSADMLAMLKEMLGNDITIEKSTTWDESEHYNVTPYSYRPKIGQKVISNEYLDFGQGLLECIDEIYKEINGHS